MHTTPCRAPLPVYLFIIATLLVLLAAPPAQAQRTAKPMLHAKHWVAVTGKPQAATAGAMMFLRDGNAVDAACAMQGAASDYGDDYGVAW